MDRLVGLAARAGFTMLRCDSLAGKNERLATNEKEAKLGQDILRQELEIFRRHGIGADLKFPFWPSCFVGDTLALNEPEFAVWDGKLDDLIESHVKPAGTAVAMIELDNEPAHQEFWSGTREQYQWLFEHARKKILAANPAMLVVHGGTCPPGADLGGEKLKDPASYETKKKAQEDWYLAFYRDMAAQGDLWAYHHHGALNGDALAWRAWEQDQLTKAGFKGRFLQTEGGSSAWSPDREVTTWAEVLQKILASWSRGEKGWLQYDLAFTTQPSRYAEKKGWAIVDAHDFTPKFQYGAIAGLAHTMAGCTLDKTLVRDTSGRTVTLAVEFHHPRGRLVAWFGDAGATQLDVRSDASQAVFIDAMGNERLTQQGGRASLRFTPFPQYLLLVGATKVEAGVEKGR